MVESIINNFKAFYHDIFRIIIPGGLLATPIVSYLQCNKNYRFYPINEIFRYYDYFATFHWLFLLALSYVIGNLLLYIFDVILHNRKYLSYYDYFFKLLFSYERGKITFKEKLLYNWEQDILYNIRNDIYKYIKKEHPNLNIHLKKPPEEAKVLLFKLMNQYNAFPPEYQTWIIFSKGMVVALCYWTIISVFRIPKDVWTSISTIAILILLKLIFILSWIIVNSWIADRVAYTYYIEKRKEELEKN